MRKKIAAKLAGDELTYVRPYRRRKPGLKNAVKRIITLDIFGYVEVSDHLRKKQKRYRRRQRS